ncbi:hypothetical protein DFH06DRAFT_190680 [Mycena polygramma]|nr:hypothetical protein DFH06DRAFT_190680 [Mycena polygramma]
MTVLPRAPFGYDSAMGANRARRRRMSAVVLEMTHASYLCVVTILVDIIALVPSLVPPRPFDLPLLSLDTDIHLRSLYCLHARTSPIRYALPGSPPSSFSLLPSSLPYSPPPLSTSSPLPPHRHTTLHRGLAFFLRTLLPPPFPAPRPPYRCLSTARRCHSPRFVSGFRAFSTPPSLPPPSRLSRLPSLTPMTHPLPPPSTLSSPLLLSTRSSDISLHSPRSLPHLPISPLRFSYPSRPPLLLRPGALREHLEARVRRTCKSVAPRIPMRVRGTGAYQAQAGRTSSAGGRM